jgi:hypothetical protein
MTVAGNLLHVTAGAAGYAVYRIPGVTATQYSLTGNCGGPVNFSISPLTQGSISASGLYTAPAAVTAGQTVVSFTVTTTQGSSSLGVRPLESLVLTTNTTAPNTGQPASLTLQATDETGGPSLRSPLPSTSPASRRAPSWPPPTPPASPPSATPKPPP